MALDPRIVRSVNRAGMIACFVVAVGSALPAVSDLGKLSSVIRTQSAGPAEGTDFLNLYSGAYLVLHAPSEVYNLSAQQAVQQQLAGRPSGLVPFYLPPHAALLVSWLALLPYGMAYVVWLAIGAGCIGLAAAWIAPRWGGGWSPLVWLGASLLYLPAFVGLAEGQTAAVMLLAFAGLCHLLRRQPHATWVPAVCVLVWTFKPQLAPWFIVTLLIARPGGAFVRLVGLLVALCALAVVVLTPGGVEAYAQLSRQRLQDVLVPSADPLPGPTLLHAVGALVGTVWLTQLIAAVLLGAALLAFTLIWRTGLARDDAALLQLAALPVVSIICAPYALVHELTSWMACFWLVWEYSVSRPKVRALLLWITACIWLAGDFGVLMPGNGGSDVAAFLGLGLLSGLAILAYAHRPDAAAGRS